MASIEVHVGTTPRARSSFAAEQHGECATCSCVNSAFLGPSAEMSRSEPHGA